MRGIADYPLLSLSSKSEVHTLLVRLGLCQGSRTIDKIEKAGEGNMNLVLRVKSGEESFIVKQSRPWVEKYPSIPASDERILAEADFYRRVHRHSLIRSTVPRVLAADLQQRILIISDLGEASDYLRLYHAGLAEQEKVDEVFEQATSWLGHLHEIAIESNEQAMVGCQPIRELNHAHIYIVPFQNPAAMDLDTVCSGLRDQSQPFRVDKQLAGAMRELGDRYLGVGGHLLHGDYYPGSWLQTEQGFRVIDPEFCFAGPIEFDLGVLIAHRVFCGAETEGTSVQRILQWYPGDRVNVSLAMQFAGAELIRRVIGVAQLPLLADLRQRLKFLETGRDWVLRR